MLVKCLVYKRQFLIGSGHVPSHPYESQTFSGRLELQDFCLLLLKTDLSRRIIGLATHPVISGVAGFFFFFFSLLNLVLLVTRWKEEVEWKRRW